MKLGDDLIKRRKISSSFWLEGLRKDAKRWSANVMSSFRIVCTKSIAWVYAGVNAAGSDLKRSARLIVRVLSEYCKRLTTLL